MNKYVLLTRPIYSSLEIEQELVEKSIACFIEPMMAVRHIQNDSIDTNDLDGVILTSANAVHALDDIKNYKVPIYTVGDQTADILKAKGFSNVVSASGTVHDLQDMLLRLIQHKSKLLYLRGADVSHSLPEIFENEEKITILEKVVYEMIASTSISDKLLNKLQNNEISHVLFFSRRTAQIFKDLIEQVNCTSYLKSIKALCLADSMLEFVSEMPWEAVYVSPKPNRQALLSLL